MFEQSKFSWITVITEAWLENALVGYMGFLGIAFRSLHGKSDVNAQQIQQGQKRSTCSETLAGA